MKTGFHTETWVAAYCHGCGEPFPNEECGPELFPSIETAVRELTAYGWQTDGDRITCDGCQLAAHCAAHGHEWTEWETWTAPPSTHTRRGRLRLCRQCDVLDGEHQR
ncbi:hypothetical protein [Nocardia sp. NPDC050406]|uniref:hypothetical protein n=1 Tax=Nocardia sp. NPDC050406 TaxID=3364318 RepID=UPI00379087F4